ncbi:uncharacterized protein LOC128278681 [Anopheles cruzii]|uniref:uncharacterized protein LOC128278681 n=1 Tax=Anopheles cruzii TaxID=68878 RepID=UPI0022EC82C9|nr:uncharacterized protein LOC128278681 [Anopheles cruzii]
MRKPCLLVAVLLPLVAASARPPAAVFEDVFELGRPNAAFLATTDSHSGMKAYLRKKKYRQLRDPVPQASTMAAYTAAHERYQSLEEKRNDRIRMENLRQLASGTSVRTKRLEPQPSARPQPRSKQPKRIDIVPREVFKFELSDAMIAAHPQDQPTGDASKARTKRSERVEPVPREIFRFELGDAMVSRRHAAKSLNTSAPAPAGAAPPLHSRHRRSANADPRDYVKFELEDGRTPEGYRGARGHQTTSSTQQPSPASTAKPPASTRTPENLRHPFTSSDSYRRGKVFDEIVERPGRRRAVPRKEKRDSGTQEAQVEEAAGEQGEEPVADMSPEESRRVRVRGRKPKQIANYEDLPPGVQKAIDIAIKENERMNGAMMTVVSAGETGSIAVTSSTPSTSYQFGDKKPKTKKPYSATTTKITEPKFVPSAKLSETRLPAVEEESNGQTGFLPSQGAVPVTGAPESATGKPAQVPNTLPGIPKAWWSYSDLRRPKRLYHKAAYQPHHHQAPLGVVSPQYVNTFKPLAQHGAEPSGSGNELSGGYHRRPALFTPTSAPGGGHASSEVGFGPADEVYIKERPKIQYVIKEIPVQVKQPRTKITVQPSISISYDKDVTGPGTGPADSGHRGYDNPYGPIELQYEQPAQAVSKELPKSFQNMKIVVPDPHDDSREQKYQEQQQQEQYQFESYKSSNEIDTTGSSIAALSALIGQRPSVQLHGLNELLHMPVPMGGQHPQRRPQDSTAPITFPESSTPAAPTPKPSRPGYRSVQIDHGPKILYDDDSLYRTVQMNPQLQVPTGKEYTPIKELVADVADSDLIGPTIAPPTHATYIIGTGRQPSSTPAPIVEHHAEFNEEEAGHESNAYRHVNVHSTPSPLALGDGLASHRYQEQHHHHHHHHHHDGSDEHYDDSEGYAFGYRVRDFHTGNDFGHVQNHDNGVTRGEYHILLPDGRVQNVRYMADEQGFHADVTYESVHQPHEAQ